MVTPTLVSSPTSSQLAPTSALRPTWTRTPSKTPIPPLAGIRITRPGLQSRVLSPFRMEANAIPSPDGLVFLELMGEDGRLLFQKTIRFLPTSESVFIQQEVEFSINGVSEAARLSIFTLDPYNRLISLSSVDLVLLSIGDEQITQPLNIRESIYIIQPYLNQAFSQGLVSIRGLISPTSSQPLKVELITADNIVLYSFELEVGEVTSDRRYYPFEFSFPFSVDSVTPSRLSLFQESDNRLAGIMAFSSQTIYLYP